jgi:hypothetical protein
MTLAKSSEVAFEDALASWYSRNGKWLKQRDEVTGEWSHQRTEGAYFSLCRDLHNLFTYKYYIGKKLANTY